MNKQEIQNKHEQLRAILMKYNNPEYGDCIIDEITQLFHFPTTNYQEDHSDLDLTPFQESLIQIAMVFERFRDDAPLLDKIQKIHGYFGLVTEIFQTARAFEAKYHNFKWGVDEDENCLSDFIEILDYYLYDKYLKPVAD